MIIQTENLSENELETIANIWLQSNLSTHDFIPAKYWHDNFDSVKNQLDAANIYLAYDNDDIVGFMGMNNNYIEGIFIQEPNMHSGLGKDLIHSAKENFDQLNLSVYSKNQYAIEFYLGQGFIKISEGMDNDTEELEIEMTWSKS